MKLDYLPNGNLVPGIHEVPLDKLEVLLGFNAHRRNLLKGLMLLIEHLRKCNCKRVYLNGSFSSDCDWPNDFDLCYDTDGVDYKKMLTDFPTILDFREQRKFQKMKYKGEIFPATTLAAPPRKVYLDFFQEDKNDGSRKGIISITLK